MSLNIRKWKSNVLAQVVGTILLANFTFAAANSETLQISAGNKVKVKGSIVSRDGDLIRVREKNPSKVVVVNITDDTKIERKKGKALFFRHSDMDVTAMVPGLTIEAEGVGNSKGQLDARKKSLTRNDSIEVAEERQLQANNAAAQNAQSTANQGMAAATVAQNSATQAQQSADQASQQAQAAGARSGRRRRRGRDR